MIWIAVGAGGALGSLARHGVNVLFAQRLARTIPYATATVNLIGSATIGVLAAMIASGKLHASPEARAFMFVGILGGFTTFSSFMLDTLTLGQTGDQALAFWNVALQTLLGLAAVWGGYRLGLSI